MLVICLGNSKEDVNLVEGFIRNNLLTNKGRVMSIYILSSLDFFCEIILDIIVVDPKDPCHVFVVHFSNNKSWSPVTYSSMLFQKNKFDAIITIIVNIYNFTQSSNRFIVRSLIMNSHYLGLFIHPLYTYIRVKLLM